MRENNPAIKNSIKFQEDPRKKIDFKKSDLECLVQAYFI